MTDAADQRQLVQLESLARPATEADLLRTPDDGYKYELVDGEIRMSPAGSRHGAVSVRLAARLVAFVDQHRLGYVFESSTGFRMPAGNVRCPDVSFVALGRFEDEQVPLGFSPVPPDLAVEVLSPDDRQFETAAPGLDDAQVWVERCGGASRADTVANGLAVLRERGAQPHDWVLVHDAARCLVRPEWVDRLIDECMNDEVGGLLALPIADTLKAQGRDTRVAGTVDRSGKWAAQTPQMFRLGLLAPALAHAGPGVTDETHAIPRSRSFLTSRSLAGLPLSQLDDAIRSERRPTRPSTSANRAL